MLALTRRESESIILTVDGKTITVILHQIKNNQAKVAIDAPKEVEIVREELLDR